MYTYVAKPYTLIFRSLKKVARLHIRDRQRKRQRVCFKGSAYRVALLDRAVRKSHVPAYRHGFFARKPHKSAYHVYALFAVSVRESVVYRIVWNSFPLPRLLVFGVSHGNAIKIHLTDIVQESRYRRGFLGDLQLVFLLYPFTREVFRKALVHVQRVPQKSALIRSVIAR